MKLNFGKIKYDGGSHTLGRLKCSGRKATSETYPTSCLDLWILGYSLNGFYPIRNGVRMDYVFCDFSQGNLLYIAIMYIITVGVSNDRTADLILKGKLEIYGYMFYYTACI